MSRSLCRCVHVSLKRCNEKIDSRFSYFWETPWGLETIFLETTYIDLSNKKDQKSIGCLRRAPEFLKVGDMGRKSAS